MYEAHFGLISKTFGTKAEGHAVFVGPRQADLISGIHQGLAARDAVVTVAGPVGVGKTTIVNRALETIHPGRMAAWVGRMAISSEEVLELLLAGFGFKRKTNSTLQRFAAFRRLMHERAAAGIPVAIVIEDARKLGAAALAEVEALTAADTADGGGANIILMGEPDLDDLLAEPDLARLKQRIRRRQSVEPLSAAEVRGYLRHAIRTAGGDYDKIFDAGVADIVTACSEGIPRIINTLCETALNGAMEAGDNTVSTEAMRRIAAAAFGFEDDLPMTNTSDGLSEVSDPSVAEPIPVSSPVHNAAAVAGRPEPVQPPPVVDVPTEAIPASARHIVVESGRYPLEPHDEETENRSGLQTPDDTAAYEPEVLIVGDDEPTLTDIPEFINDTQPELDALRGSETGEHPLDNDEETFDLDAVLSPEVESTNMMPAVTADLDTMVTAATSTNRMPELTGDLDEIIAQIDGSQPAKPGAPAFNPEDLPTLSDSMRVDFERQVGDAEPAVDPNTNMPEAEDSAGTSTVEPASFVDASTDETVAQTVADEDPAETSFDLDSVLESQQETISEAASAGDAVEAAAQPQPLDDSAPEMSDPMADSIPVIPEADLSALQAELDAVKIDDGAIESAPEVPQAMAAPADSETGSARIDTPDDSLDQVIANQQLKNEEMYKFAEHFGSARSQQEVDESMVETVQGEEIDKAAAAAVATGTVRKASERDFVAPVASNDAGSDTAANLAVEQTGSQQHAAVARDSDTVSTEENQLPEPEAASMDPLQHLKNQLDDERSEFVEMGQDAPHEVGSTFKGPQLEPIERQINTSMTQALEALNVAKIAEAEKADKKSSGFFSKFRRSS